MQPCVLTYFYIRFIFIHISTATPYSPSVEEIFVEIGCGVRIAMSVEEAGRYADSRVISLQRVADSLSDSAAELKSQCRLVLEVSFSLFHITIFYFIIYLQPTSETQLYLQAKIKAIKNNFCYFLDPKTAARHF